ncbi:MAG: DNA ligase, partial [Candidatus Aenigmatarchaeota archaeon]
MKYRRLAEYYERLESTTKNLEKIDIVAELFREAKKEDLEILALAVMGQVFPEYSEQEIGIASKLMRKVIASAYGVSEEEVLKHYRDSGDLGLTAEHFAKNKRQRTLGMRELTVEKVFENIRKLPEITGARSQERKIGIIKELLVSSSPKEAKYIVRTILGEMRVGVGEGTVRDAIAKAFGVSPQVVEDAYNLLTDYGEVALIAKEKGEEGLKNVSLQIGKPIRVMLAESASSM